jgi:hypothetical protein
MKKMYKKGNKSEKKTFNQLNSKKIKSTKIIRKKKICKKWQFWKKNKKRKINIWGKLKLDYQPAQYWKNKFDKDNVLKKYMGKHCSKTKTM